jgi:MoaA/NifB/PqqE/SkfB family radical SAM enzyme
MKKPPNKFKLFIYKLANGFSFLKFQFTINVANPCNRKCNFCPNHAPEIVEDDYQRWWKSQPGFMSYEKFADFLKRMGILRFFIKQLSLTGRGETLLHPDILKFCEVANKYKILHHVTTNGDFLTQKLEQDLSRFKHLHFVRVSLFDPNRAQYWLKRKADSPIRIEIQNVTNQHIDGIEDGFISINNPGTEQYCTMPKNFVEEKACTAPFSFNTLNTDGSLVTCITFYEVGNVFEQPFWKIWNGKKMRWIRKQGLKMAIPEELALCKNCGVFYRFDKYKKMNKYINN